MSFIDDLADDFRRWGKKRILKVRAATKKFGVNDGGVWCDSDPTGVVIAKQPRPEKG